MKKAENNTDKLRENATWASITDEFLNSPPTSSIFRLYLLCFVVWNKALILFIVFDPNPMGEKLSYSNWVKYTPLDFGFWVFTIFSTYGVPILLASAFYTLSLVKIGELSNQSLFFWLKSKHLDEANAFNKKRADTLNIEESIIEKEDEVLTKKIDIIEKKAEVIKKEKESFEVIKKEKEELYKKAPKAKKGDEGWAEDYKYFKNTSHFTYFNQAVKELYYDTKNSFEWPKNNQIQARLLLFLSKDSCIDSNYDEGEPGLDTNYWFNDKGIFYIKNKEFEDELQNLPF